MLYNQLITPWYLFWRHPVFSEHSPDPWPTITLMLGELFPILDWSFFWRKLLYSKSNKLGEQKKDLFNFPLKLVIIQLECRPYCGWKKQGSCGGGRGRVLHVKRATRILRDLKEISITILTIELSYIQTRQDQIRPVLKYNSFRDSPSLGEGWVEISIFMPILSRSTRPLLCNVMGKGLHSSHSRPEFCSIIKDDSRSCSDPRQLGLSSCKSKNRRWDELKRETSFVNF